ncbi:MAG: glycosyltransferase family 2 protein [Formosimonas sp.]
MSLVSTIIPFYNGNDTIARAIDSVLGSPQSLEVIVMVDASPEALVLTDAQRAAVAQGHLRVVESATNLGQAAMRNMGVSLSLAPFVSFMDQDDMYLPNFCAEMSEVLLQNPHLAAVECGAEIVKNGVNVLNAPDPRYFTTMNSVPWNVLVRRNAFWQAGAFPIDPEFRKKLAGEDIAFKQAIKHYFAVGSDMSRQLLRHYLRDGSATDNYLNRTEIVDGEIVFKEVFENEASGEWNEALQRHWGNVTRDIEMHRRMSPQGQM